jgi:prepilin-type N-terminal cleavage/methylation domain-containing protein
MTQVAHSRPRSGFTLLELAVAVVLFALVMGNVYTILGGTTKALGERNSTFEADVQAQRALDRIAMAVIGSREDSIYDASESPGFQAAINYEEFLGMGDPDGDGSTGEVFSPPMRIALTSDSGGEVSWFENPDTENQKRVVWVKDIPQFARGEIPGNGLDDNGNGLIDETGLAFVKQGKAVQILLSLRRPDGKGGFLERELQTTVTCRN